MVVGDGWNRDQPNEKGDEAKGHELFITWNLNVSPIVG